MASVLRQPFRLRLATILIATLALLAAMVVIGPPEVAAQEASEFTVTLVDSQGNPLAGGTARYYVSALDGGWKDVTGATDGNGELVIPVPSATVHMFYMGSNQQQTRTQLQESNNTFQTTQTTIAFKDSAGNPLDSSRVQYYANNAWRTFGDGFTTNGTATQELLPGSYSFTLDYNARRQQVSHYPVSGTTTEIVFQTGQVTLHHSGVVRYYGLNSWHTFNQPTMEFLPGDWTFYLNGYAGSPTIVINVVAGQTTSSALVRLVDHQGNGLAGGTATHSYSSGWPAVPGATDANGYLIIPLTGNVNNLHVRMNYMNTAETKTPSQLAASNFTFKTTLVTVKLRDADGNPLDTGKADYHAYYNVGGGNGLTVNGDVSQEMLPGNIPFGMSFNGKRVQENHVVSGTTTDVVFQTGRVTLHYSGSINHGSWISFQKPAMEFLPGTWKFHFNSTSSPCTVDIPVAAGDKLVKSVVAARLTNSSNQGIPGGTATAYVGGSWKAMGETNNQGWICTAFDGKLGNTSVKMTLDGTSQQLTQNHATNSIYLFKTTAVVVELIDSNGNRMDTGSASYYAGSWRSLGDTVNGVVTTTQMLPGKYSFAMVYNGTRQQLNSVDVGANSTVTFQTAEVTVKLLNSNDEYMDTGSASYYAGSWRTIGDTNGGVAKVQMLPGSYSFAMVYNGTRQQLNSQPISGTTSYVYFRTVAVTVELVDSNNAPLAGGASSYYASKWWNIDESGEVQMLPGSYSFAMTYLGTREQKNSVAISGASTTVTFQTGQVESTSGTANGYYAGSWRTFTNGMELLKGTYTFRFSGSPNQSVVLPGDGTPTTIN